MLSSLNQSWTIIWKSLLPRTLDFDILSWWKTNGIKYPTLHDIARNILAIPVSTVASESAFSTSGRIVSPLRNRLHSKTVEALMCGRDWLWNEIKGSNSTALSQGYTSDNDVENEGSYTEEVENITLCK
ncbi:hypothetical protein L3X38_036023 [Prunus dulcis]|uniref:HAT C-terminal dimerisation domain-containing protein n=1 Tax=Prunus dulcis TaxID=3755 RepID=A0AAD4V231_PRUDU|nr:hypothetical protein L3X38_036023 [Prunus dulcis]